VFHLPTISPAQADDSANLASINKGDVVQDLRLRYERDHARFVVFEAFVDPYQRGVPVKLDGHAQKDPVLLEVRPVFG